MLKSISYAALALTTLPSVLYLSGTVSLGVVKWIALAGTIAWFVATPLWMGRELEPDADQVQM